MAKDGLSVFIRLCFVLVDKVREIPADNLELIREYIEEIKKLYTEAPDG
jgi:hypothetical protein